MTYLFECSCCRAKIRYKSTVVPLFGAISYTANWHEKHGLPENKCNKNAVRYMVLKATMPDDKTTETVQELKQLAAWVRAGEYNRDDARDEIARAIENRARALHDATRLYPG